MIGHIEIYNGLVLLHENGSPSRTIPMLRAAYDVGLHRKYTDEFANANIAVSLLLETAPLDLTLGKVTVVKGDYRYLLNLQKPTRRAGRPYWRVTVLNGLGATILPQTNLDDIREDLLGTDRVVSSDPRVQEFAIRVPSHNEPNTYYTVKKFTNGDWECTCKGWRYRGVCSHIMENAWRNQR
jgi:hypothetical protein